MRELALVAVALIVHECGHILTAALFGIPIVSFNIRSLGAVITFDFSHTGYFKEAAVHLSGPIFGLLLAVFACLLFGSRASYFAGLSVALSAVNLLPISGFDGGGIARSLLSQFLMPDTVWRTCRILSAGGVILLWTAVLWIELRAGGNIGLMIFVLGVMLGQMK